MDNPDLLNSTGTQQQRVQPIHKFRNRMEDGTIVASHPILPTVFVTEPVAYFSSSATTSFHREDGKRLGFLNHFFETNIKADIEYLDREIIEGNVYIRHATEEEVYRAHMHRDPEGTAKARARTELENDPEFIAQLEARILARLQANNSDESKIAGIDAQSDNAEKVQTGNATIILNQPTRLGGIGSSASSANAKDSVSEPK
jgi:hypothetical protein